ncbi:MAG: hypothetical protein ACE5G2_02580 [Candidatus Krumholzibacteriia bacterium]
MGSTRFRLGLLLGATATSMLVSTVATPPVRAQCITVTPIPDQAQYNRGDIVSVEINVGSDISAENIIGFSLILAFDSDILDYLGAQTCAAGITVPGDWTIMDNSPGPDEVRVAGAGVTPLSGSGCLRICQFQVRTDAPLGDCSQIALVNMILNNGSPCVSEGSAQVCVIARKVSGTVTYYKAGVGSACNGSCVPEVSVKMTSDTGCTVIVDQAVTSCGVSPSYELFAADGESVYVCYERQNTCPTDYFTGDVGDAIDPQDVGTLLQYFVLLSQLNLCPLSQCAPDDPIFESLPQRVAADVDLDGAITPLDAGLIAQTAAAIATGTTCSDIPAAFSMDWQFFCDQQSYLPLTSDQVYDPIAVLPGDVDGSYQDTAKFGKSILDDVALVVPYVYSGTRDVFVPVELRGTVPGALGVQARVQYDAEVLRFVAAAVGAAAPGRSIWTNEHPGIIGLVLAGAAELDAEGPVALLHFERLTPDGERVKSRIDLDRAKVGSQNVRAEGGQFSTFPTTLESRSWSTVKDLYRE